MKSIVFLRSNPVSPDPRVAKEARSLTKNGFKVLIVGWDREDIFKPQESSDFGEIYRIKLRAKFGRGLKNLKYLIRWQFALFFWLSQNRTKYDCMHSCDFDTVIPALLCKFLYKKKVVYDIFDFYADMLRNVPAFLRRMIRKIDLFLIGFTNAVIIADESRIEQIEGSKSKKLVVVYNSPDYFVGTNLSGRRDDKFDLVVGYVGLFQKERGILEMIDVIRAHSNWKLILGGYGGDEDLIVSSINGAKNIEFVGKISYDITLSIYASSDVLFATYDPSIPNHRYSSANKLFEAMMLGKPIIVANGTGMDNTVRKYGLGFVVNYGDKLEVENALKNIEFWDNKKWEEHGERARKVFYENFSWENMEKRLIELYSEICEGV
jgi:glycosyltransferase involved in cell wall biosynthesis